MSNNRDITVHEFCNATNTEDLSIEFARQHNLILAADKIRQQHQRNGFCLMGTPNCNDELRETTVYNACRHKNYDVMRCSLVPHPCLARQPPKRFDNQPNFWAGWYQMNR
uniref:Uncharacterized protein n=1 Tax=Romanomermis culicivorax TaxID=13658 RepID=A0A915K1U5_ROMCU